MGGEPRPQTHSGMSGRHRLREAQRVELGELLRGVATPPASPAPRVARRRSRFPRSLGTLGDRCVPRQRLRRKTDPIAARFHEILVQKGDSLAEFNARIVAGLMADEVELANDPWACEPPVRLEVRGLLPDVIHHHHRHHHPLHHHHS